MLLRIILLLMPGDLVKKELQNSPKKQCVRFLNNQSPRLLMILPVLQGILRIVLVW